MNTPALILAEDDGHCLATWDRTLIQIWRRATTTLAAENMCAVARTFAAQHPTRATSLSIVESASAIPGAGAREAFGRFTRESATRMACCAVVPEGGGFRSATVRSVLGGLGALMPRSFPYQFAEDLEAAINLLGPYLSDRWNGREDLRRAITELRARIDRSSHLRAG